MHALSEKELLQICRKYEFPCPVCEARNTFYRLKPDICRPGDQEGDGHPRAWRWSKSELLRPHPVTENRRQKTAGSRQSLTTDEPATEHPCVRFIASPPLC